MFRNKDAIVHTSQVASAMYKVFEIVKLLRLSQAEFDDMINIDITSKVCASVSRQEEAEIRTYTRGLRDGLSYSLIKDHCEFVFYADGERVPVADAHNLHPNVRAAATSGYEWKDSDLPFTEFKQELQL